MDAHGRYSASERAAFASPPCPECGSTNVAVRWVDAASLADPPGADVAIPSSMRCRDCATTTAPVPTP